MRLNYDATQAAGNHVLLFYKQHEVDRFVPGDRYLKRMVRPLYNRFHSGPKVNGFGVNFEMLCRGLAEAGFIVHRNDYALARDNPDYPVGLVGGPALIESWRLPNPAILGPTIYDQPGQAPRLFDDPRFHSYICLADWMYNLFETTYRGRCTKWHAGIDTEAWPDLADQRKEIDFLIYDKVRWDHDQYTDSLIEPVRRELDRRGLTHETIRYLRHDHATFKRQLARSRSLLFLCENETQGIAYQEAMASGLPVLAWDRGYWADPQWRDHLEAPPAASSVPFFSNACGERFVGAKDFAEKLDLFQGRWAHYRPRDYVIQSLNFAGSAALYANAYFSPIEAFAGARAAA